MIDIELDHRFPSFRLDVAFRGPERGVTVVFGPSGCGKSTLLACIAGLLRPDRGRIAIGERVLLDTDKGVALPPERRRCGVVFQDSRLFPHFSVATNLRFGARRAPPEEPGPSFEAVVDLLGIAPLLARRPGALSGGERQRVALGRALLSRPRLLLLDEPLAALDAGRRAEILPFLAAIWPSFGIPMLYVTHALDEVDRLADTLLLMDGGRALASGPLEEIVLRPDVPLAARSDSGAVLSCTVARHDAERTHFAFAGGALVASRQALPTGTAIRVRVQDRDVAVATEPPRGLSIQNILPAILERLDRTGAGEVLLTLRVGPSALLARITTAAAADLALAPGQPVWALVKAVTIGSR